MPYEGRALSNPAPTHDLSPAFDAAFAARTTVLACRPRLTDDAAFLIDCAVACSPLVGMLPHTMIAQQAAFHRSAHDAAHPDAMHRIVTCNGIPIAHILVTWTPSATHGVDIAVLPRHRATGAGSYMLRAWLAVADAHGLMAKLEVRADNPARRLYARLGFAEIDADPFAPIIDMQRAPRRR